MNVHVHIHVHVYTCTYMYIGLPNSSNTHNIFSINTWICTCTCTCIYTLDYLVVSNTSVTHKHICVHVICMYIHILDYPILQIIYVIYSVSHVHIHSHKNHKMLCV